MALSEDTKPQSEVVFTEEYIEEVIVKMIKVFLDNKIEKPASGVAMMVLLERLKSEGYVFGELTTNEMPLH